MAQFASENFNGTDFTELSVHNSAWTRHTAYTVNSEIYTNRLKQTAAGTSAYWHSGTPINANYTVDIDIYVVTNIGFTGVIGRVDTAADTFYMWRYFQSAGAYQLYKAVAGTYTQLGSDSTATLTVGGSYPIQLKMDGTNIEGFVSGVSKVGPITDSAITAKGKAGLRGNNGFLSSGYHLDNFSADDIIVASGFTERGLGRGICRGIGRGI